MSIDNSISAADMKKRMLFLSSLTKENQDEISENWSEDNRNVYAFWPRLSNNFIDNNNQTSTWWMRNGAFLRLKSVELGYNVPKSITEKYRISGLRLYANTTNPVVFSQFKLWDPEMGGNGLGYPVQSTYNFGILLDL